MVKPVPVTDMPVSGDWTVNVLGEMEVIVSPPAPATVTVAAGEVPPPGGGLVTVTASVPAVA